jgi:hypothetical protein
MNHVLEWKHTGERRKNVYIDLSVSWIVWPLEYIIDLERNLGADTNLLGILLQT